MTTFPIGPQSLPTGDALIAAVPVPAGTHKAVLSLDVTNMVNQVVVILVEYWDGTLWTGTFADFNGPWRNKQGVLQNTVSLSFDFGSIADASGAWVPRVSIPGWQVRAKFTVTNGPFNTAGGTLVLT